MKPLPYAVKRRRSKRLGIQLPVVLIDEIKARAKRDGESFNEVVRAALRLALETEAQ